MVSRAPALPTASDKYQITNAPVALPGACIVCNRTADGVTKFLDFNLSLDYYGAVIFCLPCLTPLGHAIGFVEIEKLLDAERECEEIRFALDGVEDELRHYRSIVDSFRAVRPNVSSDDSESGQDQESNNPGFALDSETAGRDDRESFEQTPGWRPKNTSQFKFQT